VRGELAWPELSELFRVNPFSPGLSAPDAD
jgi:hypothetical protein